MPARDRGQMSNEVEFSSALDSAFSHVGAQRSLDLTVPDFFQENDEDALRSQVDWLVRSIGADDKFFAAVLGISDDQFAQWRAAQCSLGAQERETLNSIWQTVLHLMSFLNMDASRLWLLFDSTLPPVTKKERVSIAAPWAGSSLRVFLDGKSGPGVEAVRRWVTGLRFGNPYAA